MRLHFLNPNNGPVLPMVEFIENIFNQVNPFTAYIVLLISAFAENVLPPIPGDTVVVLGAYLVSIDKLDFWGVYISTTFGSVAGFGTMYFIGRHFGRAFLYKKSHAKFFKEEYINKAEIWFSNWGYWVIVANRFLSGTRSVISLFSGIFHLNGFVVLLLSLLSAAIWNAMLIIGGILLGNNWHIVANIVSHYNQIIVLLLILVLGYFFVRWIISKKKSNANPG